MKRLLQKECTPPENQRPNIALCLLLQKMITQETTELDCKATVINVCIVLIER